jgi:hypothetical protein
VEMADATTTNTEAQKNDWGRMRTVSLVSVEEELVKERLPREVR